MSNELNALSQEDLAKSLKERLESIKDGVVSKVKRDRIGLETARNKAGLLSEEDVNLLSNGLLDFSMGTKIKKYKDKEGYWVLVTKNGKYPCVEFDDYLKVYYKDDITNLKGFDEEELKIILLLEVIRRDNAMIFVDREKYLLDLDPTQEAKARYGKKAQRKVDKRAQNYRDRVDRWWNVAKEKAEEEEGGFL